MRSLYLVLFIALAVACQNEQETNPLAGSYSLIEWKGITEHGEVVYPYGQKATGQLIYLEDGSMSMQLEGDDRPELGTDDYSTLDSLTILKAYQTYFSYYGTYALDNETGIVTHVIEGCKHPDWKGRKLQRKFQIEGEQLIIRSDSVIGMDHVLTWRRSSNSE
ncbi:MAG: hypothetical protein HKN79_11235 [Flavobacteriales bacterium]|nr:hypothetical protein [Flavobacteriales bacterium]